MRTITKNLYQFDELSEEAKENAIEHQRNGNMDYFWSEDNKKTLEEFENHFPIKVGNWEYGYHNFINFEMTCEDEISELKGIRLMKYLSNNFGYIIFANKYMGCLEVNKQVNHSRVKSKQLSNGKWFNPYYSNVFKEFCCNLTGYCMDMVILQPIYDFLKNPKENTTFEELMEDCLNVWIDSCRKDYEYQYSDEAISEHLECNEYEFYENGDIV